MNVADVNSLSQLVDYLAQATEGLAALVLVLTGALAWAVRSYVSTLGMVLRETVTSERISYNIGQRHSQQY